MSEQPRQIPRWAQIRLKSDAAKQETPDIGVEPPYVPKLPTRLIPFSGRSAISSLTLSDVVSTTQRILNYISYEVVYQASSDVIDLRSAGDDVLSLAKLTIDPFDEGSFVIPGTLTEDVIKVNGKEFSGADVLERFEQVMRSVSSLAGDVPASISILQAVEELGRITRREAFIEYRPSSPRVKRDSYRPVIIDNDFIATVSQIRKQRVDPHSRFDSVEGKLIAIDLGHSSLQLRMDDKTVVKGAFGEFARPLLIDSVNKRVRLSGTVTIERRRVKFINTVVAELVE